MIKRIKLRKNYGSFFLTFSRLWGDYLCMTTGQIPGTDLQRDDRISINDHSWLRLVDSQIAVFVGGIPLLTYDAGDKAAERLAMTQLVESGAAKQKDVAEAFKVKRATVYRQRRKYVREGVTALMPKKTGPKRPRKTGGRRDKVILKLKKSGQSNRAIAQKLGCSEGTIRNALKRLGYQEQTSAQQELRAVEGAEAGSSVPEHDTGEQEAAGQEQITEAVAQDERPRQGEQLDAHSSVSVEHASEQEPGGQQGRVSVCAVEEQPDKDVPQNGNSADVDADLVESINDEKSGVMDRLPGIVGHYAAEMDLPAVHSLDPDPSSRDLDRFFARIGRLDDAAPLFESATGVQGAGALLGIPVLVRHGVFRDAADSFNRIEPAFYGLRNTVLALVLCFFLRINRPENLKGHSPTALGRLMGLDRAPEMKTLRRKIRTLAKQKKVLEFAKRQVRRHLGRVKKDLLWVYVDGHVSVYSGKRKLKKHHVTRLRISLPSVLDYWVNDENGDPLMVFTGVRWKGMVAIVEQAIKELRGAGERRVITVVFDREGWSPAFFARLQSMEGVRFVTYRKASRGKKLPRVAASEFAKYKAEFDREEVEYDLADRSVYIDYGTKKKKKRLVLRQVTRIRKNGDQTHIVTNDRDTPTVELAYRMFSRWSQENFLKYMRNELDFDGLVTYLTEQDEVDLLVTNPERTKLTKNIKAAQAELDALMAEYGAQALNNEEGVRPTMRGFKIANGDLGQEIRRRQTAIDKLKTKRSKLPTKVPLSSIADKETRDRVHIETRHLMHVFRMATYRAETALRELCRPWYPRWRHDGRRLVQIFLHTKGDLEVADGQLRVTLEPQSAPHRTRVLVRLCAELNTLNTKFPGSNLLLHFAVRGVDEVSKPS